VNKARQPAWGHRVTLPSADRGAWWPGLAPVTDAGVSVGVTLGPRLHDNQAGGPDAAGRARKQCGCNGLVVMSWAVVCLDEIQDAMRRVNVEKMCLVICL
jgi:hypothetical protein